MDNQQKKTSEIFEKANVKEGSSNNSAKSEPRYAIDDDQTEEIPSATFLSQDNKLKKRFVILGIITGACILITITLFAIAQMKTDEINKNLDLGGKYLEEGKYEEAILAFDDVIAIDAKQVAAFEGKAEVYIATQKYDKAEQSLNEARQIEPSSKTNLLLVEVYDKTEKPDEADTLLEETITLLEADIKKTSDKTELTNLYDQLILAYQRIGKNSGSIRTLCDQAYKATENNKYEILMKSLIIGNTSGNSVNDGLVAQQGDWIYYRNSSDNGCLYKISTDGTKKMKLNSEDTLFINVIDDWIYYRNGKNNSIYKVKTDGSENTLISSDANKQAIVYMKEILVAGDWIYYNNSDDWCSIYKMKTDGTEKTKITKSLSCGFYVNGDWIYFSGAMNVGNLCKIKIDGSEYTDFKSSSYVFNIVSDWLYFPSMDSTEDQDQLCKINTSGANKMKISNSNCQTLNIVDDWIYFTKIDDDYCLYKIRIDGTSEKKLNTEKSYNINIANDWIYYSTSYDNSAIYKIRTDGSDRQKVE